MNVLKIVQFSLYSHAVNGFIIYNNASIEPVHNRGFDIVSLFVLDPLIPD